jgi:DNA-binding protein H-NS
MLEAVQEARAKLAALENQAKEANDGIAAALADALEITREAVGDLIAQSGFTRAEVLGIDSGPAPAVAKAKRARNPAGAAKGLALRSNPGRVYTRGRMPAWMTIAMKEAGLDPARVDDRAAFRCDYMISVDLLP